MRAVTMQDAKLTVAMISDPVPGPGEVLVDVLACGICGTDLHCAAHGPELNAATKGAAGIELMDLSRPIVFGHEFVGRVVSYGPGTEARIPVGRRVVSMPVLPPEQPVLLGFAGPEAPGRTPSGWCCRASADRVPDHVSTEVAALTEPLAVAYRTVARAALASNDVPLVVGCDYTPQEFAQTFAHLAAGELDAAALLTGTVGFDGVADAFERLGNSPSDAKILIDPSR
jgi:threonine dehydrogenase-like Zn-dependent dehydrogenase